MRFLSAYTEFKRAYDYFLPARSVCVSILYLEVLGSNLDQNVCICHQRYCGFFDFFRTSHSAILLPPLSCLPLYFQCNYLPYFTLNSLYSRNSVTKCSDRAHITFHLLVSLNIPHDVSSRECHVVC